MDENLKREIILEHYQNPLNRKKNDDERYQKVNTRNASCIDNLDISILIDDSGIIKDITFEGEACAISISSTSIMIESLINQKVEDALIFIDNFEKMLDEKPYDESILKNAIVYDNVAKQNSRKTCATLPYRGIKKILIEYLNK